MTRHSYVGMGELYWFQLPFILLSGLFLFLKKKHVRELLFLFCLLLLYPVSSMFTSTEPQATRSIMGVIPHTLLTAYGIYSFFNLFKKKTKLKFVMSAVFIIAVVFSINTLLKNLKNYPLFSSHYWGWQYGFEESLTRFKKYEKDYDSLFITHRFNRGEELLRFFSVKNPCEKCHVMNNPIIISPNKKELFSLRQDDLDEAKRLYSREIFHQKEEILLPNGIPELFIGYFSEK